MQGWKYQRSEEDIGGLKTLIHVLLQTRLGHHRAKKSAAPLDERSSLDIDLY